MNLQLHTESLVEAEPAADTETIGSLAASDAGESAEVDLSVAVKVNEQPSDPDSPESYQDAHLRKIHDARQKITFARAHVHACKDDLKDAKEAYESAVTDLLSIIDRGPDRQQSLPLNGEMPRAGESKVVGEPGRKSVPSEDDSWKSVSLTDLDIPESILRIIAENTDPPLTRVGELSDYTSTGRELGSIKGIGPAKATVIEEALEAFWATRNGSQS